MSVRMRHTRSHTHNRRSHHALRAAKPVASEKGALMLPHRVDEQTGLYRGVQIAAPAKARKSQSEKHDHPHGTRHEHVDRGERDEHKPAETAEAPASLTEEREHGTRPRSPRESAQDPGD